MTGVVVRGAVVVNGDVVTVVSKDVATGGATGALTGSVVVVGVVPISVTGNMGGRSMRSPPSGRTWITQPVTRMSKPIAASAVGRVSRFMKPPVAIKTRSSCKIVALSYH